MEKSKRKRFEEVASSRVNKVLNAMESLQKCSNTYNYEYNDADVKKMMSAIKSQFDELRSSFDNGLSKSKGSFKF